MATDSNQRGKAPSVAAERTPAMDVDSAKRFFGHEGSRVSDVYYRNMMMLSASSVGMKVDDLYRLMSSPEVRETMSENRAAAEYYVREDRKFSDQVHTMSPERLAEARAAFSEEVIEPRNRVYERFAAATRAVTADVAAPARLGELERDLARRVGRLADGTWGGRGLTWPPAQQVGQTSVPSLSGAPRVGGHVQGRSHEQGPSVDR